MFKVIVTIFFVSMDPAIPTDSHEYEIYSEKTMSFEECRYRSKIVLDQLGNNVLFADRDMGVMSYNVMCKGIGAEKNE